jgi:hypothetical protein
MHDGFPWRDAWNAPVATELSILDRHYHFVPKNIGI